MVHILQNKNSEFYWLTVVRKGRSFEENGRSTQPFTQKHNCIKSITNEASLFSGTLVYVVDHTTKGASIFDLRLTDGKWKRFNEEVVDEQKHRKTIREVFFVQDIKK